EIGTNGSGHTVVAGIAYDADDFERMPHVSRDSEGPTDGILIWPKLLGHRIIDDGHITPFGIVRFAEDTSTNYGNLQGLEIVAVDHVAVEADRWLARRHFITGNFDCVRIIDVAHWDKRSGTCGLDPRCGANPAHQLQIEFAALCSGICDLQRIHR